MGSLLLAAGAKGKRHVLPNARVMIHQGSAGFQGSAADIEVQAREILRIQKRMEEIYSFHTGKSVETIRQDLSRDFWMGAQETVEYGIVDQVVGKPAEGEGLQDTPPSTHPSSGTNGTNGTNGTATS
jgi:ATP-dependent Clp protease protease subunit